MHGKKGIHRKSGRRVRGRLFGAGELRLAFIALLDEGPAHGYELMQRLADKTGGRYEPSAGATYPVLQQLLDEELANASAEGGKKIYSLTGAGRSLVVDNEDFIRQLWQRAAKWRQWSALDGPEVGDLPELRELARTIVATLPDAQDPAAARSKVQQILSAAIDQIRAIA